MVLNKQSVTTVAVIGRWLLQEQFYWRRTSSGRGRQRVREDEVQEVSLPPLVFAVTAAA